MKIHRSVVFSLLAAANLIGVFASVSAAQISAGRPFPGGAPPDGPPGAGPRPGPPPMTAFDEAMARDHLARIDETCVFPTLQLNLFMRPTGSLNADRALEMVAEQAARETPGSRRWVLLQTLRGFGGFMTRGQNAAGNEGYKTLFSTPPAPDAAMAVASALTNYLGMVTGSGGVGRSDTTSSSEVLLAAMNAYLALPDDKVPADPSFAGALKATGGHQQIAKALESRLKEKPASDAARLRLLKLAALVYEAFDAERALELLDEAAPLAEKIAPDDAAFNDLRVRLLVTNDRLKDAVVAQRAFVTRTGKGRTSLLTLQVRAGDAEGFRTNVDALKKPDAETSEIFAAVTTLRRLPDKGAIQPFKAARELAESYLLAPRERPLQSELSMKFTLARLLYAAREREAAVKLLQDIPEPPAEAGVAARNLYRSLQRAVTEMQEGKYYDSWN